MVNYFVAPPFSSHIVYATCAKSDDKCSLIVDNKHLEALLKRKSKARVTSRILKPIKQYIEDFKIHCDDLNYIIDNFILKNFPRPLIGIGHSMGGCILLSYFFSALPTFQSIYVYNIHLDNKIKAERVNALFLKIIPVLYLLAALLIVLLMSQFSQNTVSAFKLFW